MSLDFAAIWNPWCGEYYSFHIFLTRRLLLFLHLTGVDLCILNMGSGIAFKEVCHNFSLSSTEKIHSWLWGNLQKIKTLFHLTQALPSTGSDAYYAPPSTAVIQQTCIHPTQCRFPVYIRPRNHHNIIPFFLPTGCLHLTNYSGGWMHDYPSQGVMDASIE